MGAIWLDRDQLCEFLSELIGRKLGLAVKHDDLEQFLESMDVPGPTVGNQIRMRSEAMEELTIHCLQRFGDPDAAHVRSSPLVTRSVLTAYEDFPHAHEVMAYAIHGLGTQLAAHSDDLAHNVNRLLDEIEQRWGPTGRSVGQRFFQEINARLYTSPWTPASRNDYDSRIELRDLFTSSTLPAEVQQFFDQRFVDYLSANAEDAATMHWRQFEGLVAEALAQAGMRVEIGPGSNDDGVDIRGWNPGQPDEAPALLLVQCKRQKEKVSKVVVKALAADVTFEGAQAGMVATTSSWSPGARETVRARSYPLIEADGDHIRQWIRAMRTPGTGPWMAD